jgi:putative glutathione S-transferase
MYKQMRFVYLNLDLSRILSLFSNLKYSVTMLLLLLPLQAIPHQKRTMMTNSSRFPGRSLCLLLLWSGFQVQTATAFTNHHHHHATTPRQSQPLYGEKLDKGFGLLEIASGVVPQGAIVKTAKESWKFVWKRFMAELAPQDKTGNYKRPSYGFAETIGVSPKHPDEGGRYHLYVGNPCPWCHRAALTVNLLGMDQSQIGVTRLQDDPIKASRGGWVFHSDRPDPLECRDLRELYDKLSPGYTGRCTAPLLVDLKSMSIVSNESSDIVRMLNKCTLGQPKASNRLDLYPESLREEIDQTNDWVYLLLNNGVYRCGFSTSQMAYDQASQGVRQGLERCNDILSRQPFLCGQVFTEADLRLLPTALRFDGAYAPLFRAAGGVRRIRDYPYLFQWLERCWEIYGVPESIDLADASLSYYKQLFPLNPGGIIPTPVTAADLGLK